MRILCLSDTHTMHRKLDLRNLEGIDVVVHTGDFSNGCELSTDEFLCWFSDLLIPTKILVAGNHDKYVVHQNDRFKRKCALLHINYLQDSGIEVDGIKFWGTPWVNQFYNWAFMAYEKDLSSIYKMIPKDTNILLSHGPAQGILDYVNRVGGGNVGSSSLTIYLKKLKKLKYHIFGHIHEGYGIQELKNYIAVNASNLDDNYRPVNIPIVIEV